MNLRKFEKFPELSNSILMALFDFVINKGFKMYFVGGMVRDRILNLEVKDIDITTNAPLSMLSAFIEQYKAYFSGLVLDKRYGTISTNIYMNGESKSVQISAMRKDVKTDGRHAEIVLTNSRELDARRRDFTINALYLDRFGAVFDDVGGIRDLKNGKIRFIGFPWRRIKEDYLRILRLYRFYGRFGKTRPDLFTRFCCKKYAERLSLISRERIRAEVFGILMSDNSVEAVKMMNADGISKVIFGKNVDTDLLWYVINKKADVLVRLYIACSGSPKILSRFVLTRHEKEFFKGLIHSLRNDKLAPKARAVLYGRPVCVADNIFTNRAIYSGVIPDFSKIRAELVQRLTSVGLPNSELGGQIRIAYYKWLLSDCKLNIDELLG